MGRHIDKHIKVMLQYIHNLTRKEIVKKNIIISVSAIAFVAIAALIAKTAYNYGYADGTKNQIICQASESQESLKQLCRR